MEKNILNQLEKIEKQYDVRILLAVESGSRAWGFPSDHSDFDVRFIYIHHAEWYLSIDPQGVGSKRDVIEKPGFNNLDISGWELTKALRLFRKSNPTLFEWLKNDVVYFQNVPFVERLLELETDVFNPIPTLHHYFNLAKGNYKKYFQGKEVKIKIYLYVVKSLLACLWIEKHKSFPPIRIQDLLSNVIDEELKHEVEQLVQLKFSGEEMVSFDNFQATNEFIETNIQTIQQAVSQKSKQRNVTAQLDELFRATLTNIWAEEAFE